ncbi:tyrosine-type recombinase/integrase [Chenggangzhangella methanolivorans]|uniref:Integrase family protein n=1 Tax=Chenggangzhangella methanolivorans TaxID=1437009 RepID=A0A9E6RE73_9HYPH|nr:integrase family protein [Chenggangzhangella methanolivorans]QZO01779.1 integrase family protein [Chenggangzhangella methanolivorans]
MAKNLTQSLIDKALRDARRDGKRIELSDGAVRGLVLRVGAGGANWSWRYTLDGKFDRIGFGDLDEWPLEDARDVVRAAKRFAKANRAAPTQAWWDEQRRAMGKVAAAHPQAEQPGRMTFAEGREAYLAEVARTRRPDTLRATRSLLNHPLLASLEQRAVADIGRRDLAVIVAEAHSAGTEGRAEHLAGALRTLWSFLQSDANAERSQVEAGVMSRLKAPERSRPNEDRPTRQPHVPAMTELGRILAIARSGAMREEHGLALELLVMTAQRRRPIATARLTEFSALPGHGGLWRIPASHRKTAERRKDYTDHVIPIPAKTWRRVAEQIERSSAAGSIYLLPAARVRRRQSRDESEVVGHMAADTLTHKLMHLPGVKATPHALRRGFATHGERMLGNSREATRIILDHNEGEETHDVTRASYALHDGTHLKWSVVKKWCSAIERACAEALSSQQDLKDPTALANAIAEAEQAYRQAEKGSRAKPARGQPTT